MSKHAIVECDDCSTARRGYSYTELWRKLHAEGWKDDKGLHLCPVCAGKSDRRKRAMDKKREIELKPCPACGGEPLVLWTDGNLICHVECTSCEVCGPAASVESKAVDGWNALPRKVERVPDAQLDALEKLAGEATPGPWATYDNSQDVFGRKPYSWFQIYAMIDGDMWVIMSANSNMVEPEELQLPATEKGFRRKSAPGQAGKNARYVAAANPAVVLALIAEVRHGRANDD